MGEAYNTVIQDRANAFLASLNGAGRVTVHKPNALGDWDVETFSPEAVKHAIAEFSREIVRLRACLENTRDEICVGPVDDVLWHSAVPACTTVDNITLALRDGWTYDGWLEAKSTQA